MTHKKLLFLAAFIAVVGTVPAGGAVFAYEGSDDTASETDTVKTTQETETETETEKSADDNFTAKMPEAQKQKVEQRKAELKQRIETVKAERATKLADKRLQACEKRQERINTIFGKATERNAKHLAVIQKIEEKVKAFYTAKNLTSEGYEAAVQKADAAEAAAVAAIETSQTATFDCASTDGANPGSAIKTAMQARHDALKDYRTAVKNLILVVKKHNGQNRSKTTDTTATEPEQETETETSTGGAE